MIDLTVDPGARDSTARLARGRGILIPTFAQMRDPSLVPEAVREKLQVILDRVAAP